MPSLTSHLIEIARSEIGVHETTRNQGPGIHKYWAATNYGDGDKDGVEDGYENREPWCAAYVCWVLREAMAKAGVKETKHFKRFKSARAFDLHEWSLEQDDSTRTRKNPGKDIQPGDLLEYTFSHVGIAVSSPDSKGYILCAEGNTDGAGSREGGAVLIKKRHTSSVGYRVRLTV